MANEIRQRQNSLGGTLSLELSAGGGLMTSLQLSSMAVVPPTHHMALTLDPDSVNGAPEIVWVTTHNASQNEANIIRAQEGTTARLHPNGTKWVHGPTTKDVGPGDPAWTLATYQNSWVSYDATYAPARYRKDAAGFVWIQGMVKSGTANVPIFTLPAGYRPNFRLLFKAISSDVHARVDVLTTGAVHWINGGNNGWVSLDGIVFYGDQ